MEFPGSGIKSVPPSLLNISKLIARAWEIYRLKWKWLTTISLLFLLILLALIGVASVVASAIQDTALPIVVLIGLFFWIVEFLIGNLFAFIFVASVTREGKKPISGITTEFPPFLWTSLLFALTIVGISGIAGIIFGIVLGIGGAFLSMAGLLTVALISYPIFLAIGIAFAVWFSLYTFIFVREHDHGFQALIKSRLYVEGYWWGTAWREFILVFPWILFAVVLPVVSSLSVLSLVIAVAFIFFLPLSISYMYALYCNFVEIKPDLSKAPLAIKKSRIRSWLTVFAVIGALIPVSLFFLFYSFNQNSGTASYENIISVGVPSSPTEVSQWASYASKKFGFTLDYPLGWSVKEEGLTGYPQSNLGRSVWIESVAQQYAQPITQVIVDIYDNPGGLSLAAWKDKVMGNMYGNPQIITSEERSINGSNALDFTYKLSDGVLMGKSDRIVVYAAPDGHILAFDLTYPFPPSHPEYIDPENKIFEHILNSVNYPGTITRFFNAINNDVSAPTSSGNAVISSSVPATRPN